MRPRLLPVLATGVLALSLLGPVTAVADDSRPSGPALPEQAADAASEHASEVLEEAQAIATDDPARHPTEGHRDVTLLLRELVIVRGDLSRPERQEADALLARPTDKHGDPYADYGNAPHSYHCGSVICMHYVTDPEDPNAPDLTDGEDEGTVPDRVEAALAAAESIHDRYVSAGYERPHPDGARGDAGEDMVDIYLADTGASGVYGYCDADNRSTNPPYHRAAYCAIDNDFAEFPGDPLENQQVTLAHEYFHAVQFAYDYLEDGWFMEATATWVEDELFDDVDDNRQYLPEGQLRRPGVPLDLFGARNNHYGNWIFFRRLTERFSAKTGELPHLVLRTWRQASARPGAPDLHSTAAVQKVLASRGSSFTEEYGLFASANRRPAATYEEGSFYPASPVTRRRLALGPGRRTATREVRLDHLTHRTFRFTPDRTRRRDWRLRLDLDMPRRATSPVARLLTYRNNGTVTDSAVRLSRSGAGRVTVGFSTRRVEAVELVVVNASRRTRCWRFTAYACQGSPRDNRLPTVFKARAFRR